MKTPIVMVQTNYIQRLTGPVAMAATARGYGIADYSMATGREMEMPDIMYPESTYSPVLIYGSVSFVRYWSALRATKPWVFADEKYLSVKHWKSAFRSNFLNYTGIEASVGDYLETTTLPPCHLRPLVATAKDITGGVYSREQLAAKNLPETLRLWVAEPVDIKAEVRIWIVHEKIATASMYRCDGNHLRTTEHPLLRPALEFAEEVIDGYYPMPHFVIDVALTDHGWRVVELNPINSSGWYAADPGVVLDAYVAGY